MGSSNKFPHERSSTLCYGGDHVLRESKYIVAASRPNVHKSLERPEEYSISSAKQSHSYIFVNCASSIRTISKMIKFVVFVLAMVVLGESQRPPYAGSANRYPEVLPRFRDEQAAAEAAIANRNQGENAAPAPSTTQATTTSTIPPDLPIDARGDVNLVNRIKTWPKDKQPFWYINSQQIEAHRQEIPPQTVRPQVNPRSFFAG